MKFYLLTKRDLINAVILWVVSVSLAVITDDIGLWVIATIISVVFSTLLLVDLVMERFVA